ncbi:MAG: hypothetical protein GXX91_10065, partial [Verrucomicrobiaceae bacterium]|nr:hypothetical protein [Verrucomicrobiaceae bacterium]
DLEIWREGAREEITITLKRFIPYLIQAVQYDQEPNFVLFAGLQFQPLDRNMMAAHNITDLKTRYFYSYFGQDEIYSERPQVIVLTEVLPDSTNTHLQDFVHRVVDSINGKKITLLQDVHDALHGDFHEEGHEEFHVIRLEGETRPLVLRRKDALLAHERIVAQYNVSSDHFIERPEILELKDLIQVEKEEDATAPEANDKPASDTPGQDRDDDKSSNAPAPAKKAA